LQTPSGDAIDFTIIIPARTRNAAPCVLPSAGRSFTRGCPVDKEDSMQHPSSAGPIAADRTPPLPPDSLPLPMVLSLILSLAAAGPLQAQEASETDDGLLENDRSEFGVRYLYNFGL
jgi:hypothetical protein